MNRRTLAARPDKIVAEIRKQLDDINEYIACHGEASVSPTLRRFVEPLTALLDLPLVLVDDGDVSMVVLKDLAEVFQIVERYESLEEKLNVARDALDLIARFEHPTPTRADVAGDIARRALVSLVTS